MLRALVRLFQGDKTRRKLFVTTFLLEIVNATSLNASAPIQNYNSVFNQLAHDIYKRIISAPVTRIIFVYYYVMKDSHPSAVPFHIGDISLCDEDVSDHTSYRSAVEYRC